MNGPEFAGASPARDMYFEDFRVGQRFTSTRRLISESDLQAFTSLTGDAAAIHTDIDFARAAGFAAPVVHGVFGIAITLGLLHELGVIDRTAEAMINLDWQFVAPIVVGDSVSFDLLVTRCRRSRRRPSGVVNRQFALYRDDGTVVQRGTSSVLVRARSAVYESAPAATDFASVPWAALLADRLAANPDFVASISTFDGSIGLQCGREVVQIRLYKGSVLEVATSTPRGATFVLAGSEADWVELALAERNDFISRVSTGHFSVSGDVFQYLRLTKTLVTMWDSIRELARSEAAI
jgi:acyl dehydratase